MSGSGIVRVRCPAKVNLFLEVLSRRPDGFHEIETVFLEVALSDTIEILPAPEGIRLEVEGADLPTGKGNLAHDAARLYLDRFCVSGGVRMRLVKRIPAAAGLGGGSSDAAGTLIGMRKLLRPDLDEDLAPLAAELGSDVPYFLAGGAAHGRGRGERLTPLPTPSPGWLVLYSPGFGLATTSVYGTVRVPEAAERRDAGDLIEALGRGGLAPPASSYMFNRLEEAAALVEPRLAEVRARLEEDLRRGEILLLSGSGSTFFVPVAGARRATGLATRWNGALPGHALAVRTCS